MKLHVPCMQCFQERGVPDLFFYASPATSDGYLRIRCRAGHDAAVVVQAAHHEILAELALNALVDGYPREAVMSMTAALERLYEYYVRVVLKSRSIPDPKIEALWKTVAAQSERQLGLFAGIFATETGSPPVFDSGAAGMRNKVAHKGYIPTVEEALEYGEAITSMAIPVLTELKEPHLAETLKAIVTKSVTAGYERARTEGVKASTYAPSYFFGFDTSLNFGVAFADRRTRLEMLRGLPQAGAS